MSSDLDRWTLVRDLVVFELKMLAEGIRDVVLIPLALFAALADLVTGSRRPGLFDDVMRGGHRFDRWLNLYGPEADPERAGVDRYVAQIERVLLEQHARGGVTRQAKETIDSVLDAVSHRTTPRE